MSGVPQFNSHDHNIPELVASFMNGHHPHEHEDHSVKGVLKSIINGEHFEVRRMVICAFKGALIGAACGVASLILRYNVRQFQRVRQVVSGSAWANKKIASWTGRGAVVGIGWYFWYHNLIHNHTHQSVGRYLFAHVTYGGILGGAFAGPYGIYPGSILGLVTAMIYYDRDHPRCPPGFEYPLPGYTQEHRNKVQFERDLMMLGRSSILGKRLYYMPTQSNITDYLSMEKDYLKSKKYTEDDFKWLDVPYKFRDFCQDDYADFIICYRTTSRIFENKIIYALPFSDYFTHCKILRQKWQDCQDYREREVFEEMRKIFVEQSKIQESNK